MVEMTSGSTPWRSIGSTTSVLKSHAQHQHRAPRQADEQRERERQPPNFIAASAKKAGTITNSPCAKLMVCEVCQSSVKPIADQRVDAAGRQTGDQQLEEVGHARAHVPTARRLLRGSSTSLPLRRPSSCAYFFSFGRVSVMTCLPSFTSPRKLMRSMSPVVVPGRLDQDAGHLVGRDGHAVQRLGDRLGSNLPTFSAAALIM